MVLTYHTHGRLQYDDNSLILSETSDKTTQAHFTKITLIISFRMLLVLLDFFFSFTRLQVDSQYDSFDRRSASLDLFFSPSLLAFFSRDYFAFPVSVVGKKLCTRGACKHSDTRIFSQSKSTSTFLKIFQKIVKEREQSAS